MHGLTPRACCEIIGERLQRARLNRNMTQAELAEFVGVSRKAVINAEKGKAQLEIFIALLIGLDLEGQLDLFLPPQPFSPIQIAKLRGKIRQRASRQPSKASEPDLDW